MPWHSTARRSGVEGRQVRNPDNCPMKLAVRWAAKFINLNEKYCGKFKSVHVECPPLYIFLPTHHLCQVNVIWENNCLSVPILIISRFQVGHWI